RRGGVQQQFSLTPVFLRPRQQRFRFAAAQPLILEMNRKRYDTTKLIGHRSNRPRLIVLFSVQPPRKSEHDSLEAVRLRLEPGDLRSQPRGDLRSNALTSQRLPGPGQQAGRVRER